MTRPARHSPTPSPAPAWRNRIVGHGEETPDQLLANPKNWRIHPKAQQDALSGVLDEVGWVQEVIVNRTTGHVVDGHLRVSLAISREEPTIPVKYVELSPEEEALVLATLDPLAGMAATAKDALESLLAEVQPGSDAVTAMLEDVARGAGLATVQEGLMDPDAVPEVGEPVSKRGDVWVCGDHRVMCGDSTSAEDVALMMGGEKAGMVFTDPPWNVAVASRIGTKGISSGQAREEGHDGIKNDSMAPDEFAAFLRAVAGMLASLVSGDIYCVMGSGEWPVIDRALRDAGFHWSATVVWVKARLVLTRRNIHTRYEPIWYGWPQHSKSSWLGSRVEDDVWEIPGPLRSVEHPTMKPVALCERAIRNSSRVAQLVIDPFLGSGTTMIAAERLGRRCYGMEIEPRYVDVAVRRWEEFTGRKAVLEADRVGVK